MFELGGTPTAVILMGLFVLFAWTRKPHSSKQTSGWVYGQDKTRREFTPPGQKEG